MHSFFTTLADRLSESPILQGLLAAACTLILEDPTTIGSGLLVADGRMGFWTAFIGVSFGIAAGDLGLCLIGRAAGPKMVEWNFLSRDKLDRAGSWLDRNLVLAIFTSRFVPGMRLPTFLGAGVLQAPILKFILVAVAASILWTLLLLTLTARLGEAALPLLGDLKWPAAAAALAILVLAQWIAARRRRKDASPRVVSHFEFWHPVIFYFPVGLYWLWLSIRHRGLTLPTAANPSIYSGGFVRESKSQILSLVPEPVRRWVAPHISIEAPGAGSELTMAVATACERLRAAGIDFPLVAKPDIGQRGAGVRLAENSAELSDYIRGFPPGGTIVLQQLAPHPCEAGVLYYRMPGADSGAIFSITLKLLPEVKGDGRSTLRELILADPRARILSELFFRKNESALDRVVPEGSPYRLVFAGNHAQGAIFKDGTRHATPELLSRIHEIATAIPEFYFGRFDIKFRSLETFLKGEDFQIVEINGAGAEATHIWDADARLGDAYQTLFEQFRILFEIGAANRGRGFAPLSGSQIIRDFTAYRKLARLYPRAS